MTPQQIHKIINPKNDPWRWGPIDGRPLYFLYWPWGMNRFNKKFPPGWTAHLDYIYDEKFIVITDYRDLYARGEKIFKKYILNGRSFKKNYADWQALLKRFDAFYNKILFLDFRKLSSQEILFLYQDWNRLFSYNFWEIGSLPETANWGGESLLTKKLKAALKNGQDFTKAMERLSAPEDFSFYQQEEMDLLSLKSVKDKKIRERKLKEHQQKYFWQLNSYHHTQVLSVDHFRKILNSYSLKRAANKIREIKLLKSKAIQDKIMIIKKYGLGNEVLKTSRRLSFCIWWQDFRKSYIFKANHVLDLFVKEISRRSRVSFTDLHYYSITEVENLARSGIKVKTRELDRRHQHLLVFFNPNKGLDLYTGKRAWEIMKPYMEIKFDQKTNELKGLVVNRGKVIGRVKIISSPKEVNKMKKGDILVASMTSPDYIVALRKAAAVVTDEGGMTCHAAIVARELKIPGIVATKIATKVLKDGDLVEVDANKGIVKKLK